MTQPATDVLAAALDFHDAGIAVIPVRADGSKSPLIAWKPYTQTQPTREQVTAWFSDGHPGLGIVTGAVSGNLELLEVEGRAVDDGALGELKETALASGLGDVWRRLAGGYMTVSPSGGAHFLVHSLAPVPGNTKLARRLATEAELEQNPQDKIKVLAETRGEGGFVVAAPSHGPVHPTGKPWQRAVGTPATIPDVTPEELDALHILFRTLDRMPEAPALAPAPARDPAEPVSDSDAFLRGTSPAGGVSPGDDYNAQVGWEQILRPAGWTPIRQVGDETFWRRPGKDTPGISATTGYGSGDWLYVFSTSTDLPAEQTLTKFAAYTHLEHHGDYSAGARELRRLGYGTPAPEQPRPAAAVSGAGAMDGPTRTTSSTAAEPAATTAPTSGGGVNAADVSAKDAHKDGPLSPSGVPAPPPTPTTYSRTDDGNALRLVDQHLHQLRYVPQRAQWLAWDGHRWRWDHAGHVHEHARHLARQLPHDNDADSRHRTRSLSARSLRNMVTLAATDPRINIDLDRLDARPYELNTPGGIIDLRTGRLGPADLGALHTRATSVTPQPGAAPRWLRFLADTFAGDPAMTVYVQRLLGLALIGAVLEQILPFAYGEGANGKTTLLGTVQRIIGIGEDGYAQAANAEMLLATQSTGHPTEFARLAGARLVVSSELEDGQRFAEAKVKQLTGRDAISGRFMRQDFFTFTPTHSLWLLANHMPAVRAGGMAFWRRVRLIPFLHTVPADQRDPHLEDRLVDDEGPQILAWLAAGAADYLRDGLATPLSVTLATAAYERDQDTVGRYVTEMCQTGPHEQQGMRVKVAQLRAGYETWCRVEGETAVSARALTLALRSRFGIQSERDAQARWYLGIRLDDTDDVSSDVDRSDRGGW